MAALVSAALSLPAVFTSPVAAAAPVAGANIIVNGDFEQPVISKPWTLVPNGTTAIPGWTTSGSGVEIIRSNWQPATGQQSLNLSSYGSSAVTQQVSTVVGTYALSWYESGNPQCTTPTVRSVDVYWNGQHVASPSFDVAGHTYTSMGWTPESLTVPATSVTSVLAFHRAANDGSCGIAIDDVQLVLQAAAAPAPLVTSPPTPATTPAASHPGAKSSTTPSSGGAGGGAGRVTPSTITSSLPTVSDAFSSPGRILISLLIAVLATLFITFPAQLFNHTFQENYDDIAAFWRRRFPFIARMRSRTAQMPARRRRLISAWLVILVGALLGGLLDPTFGFNVSSLTTYLSVVIATLWGIGVSTAVVLMYRKLRGRPMQWQLQALPAGLLIALGCMVLSRLSDFQPGYLYGVVCGAAFATALAKQEQGHSVAITTLVTVILAFVAWLVWNPVNAAVGASAGWPLVIVDDFLGSIFVGGLIGSTIAMVPLRFLPGGALAGWHRGVWSGVTAIVIFAFVAILLLPGRGGHPGHAAIATVITLFVVFASGSVLFALYWARKRRRALLVESPATSS